MGYMGKFYSRAFTGRGYAGIPEGRWHIKINLAPVSDSVTPMTRTDSSPAVGNVKFTCEVCDKDRHLSTFGSPDEPRTKVSVGQTG